MRQSLRATLMTLTLTAGISIAFAGFNIAAAQGMQQPGGPQPQQGGQQEKLNLNSSKEQAVMQGLANQPAHSVPGFSGQVGSKVPSSETAQALPSDVQDQVPEAKRLLFIKLPDRIVLVDPDDQAVAEIIMTPVTTGSPPSDSPGR